MSPELEAYIVDVFVVVSQSSQSECAVENCILVEMVHLEYQEVPLDVIDDDL